MTGDDFVPWSSSWKRCAPNGQGELIALRVDPFGLIPENEPVTPVEMALLRESLSRRGDLLDPEEFWQAGTTVVAPVPVWEASAPTQPTSSSLVLAGTEEGSEKALFGLVGLLEPVMHY